MEEYLALPDGAGRFTQDFTGPALLRIPLPSSLASPTGLSPAMAGLPRPFVSLNYIDLVVLQPQMVRKPPGLGCSAFARHYLRNHYCFLFLGLLRCFSSARSPPVNRFKGLPHSEIRGSTPLCGSPQLIAALHVLHRLSMPRHPPCALRNLVFSTTLAPVRRVGLRKATPYTWVLACYCFVYFFACNLLLAVVHNAPASASCPTEIPSRQRTVEGPTRAASSGSARHFRKISIGCVWRWPYDL